MSPEIKTVLIAGLLITCFLYLAVNIYMSIRARKRLEVLLKKHKNVLEESFKKQKNKEDFDQEYKYEIMLIMLRREIEKLNGSIDKDLLLKALNRKNFNNQKKYAERIFSESGLTLSK